MTAAAFNKIERGLREALEVAQAGDDEIADRLTREKKPQDSIRACIETQELGLKMDDVRIVSKLEEILSYIDQAELRSLKEHWLLKARQEIVSLLGASTVTAQDLALHRANEDLNACVRDLCAGRPAEVAVELRRKIAALHRAYRGENLPHPAYKKQRTTVELIAGKAP